MDGDILGGHTGSHGEALPGSSRERGILGTHRDILGTHRDTPHKQAAPGAEMPAGDDAVAAGREAPWARDGHYCFTGPTPRWGPGWGPSL